jgi:ubiquinone/menaquinone biosynthesis C-methylase UbiE
MKTNVGERLETTDLSESTSEHLHRYALAQKLVEGKIVLDIASGEGYGSNLLAQNATKVVGVDIDASAVDRASKKYNKSNLIFKQGSASLIPSEEKIFDVVVSFETLEHHDKHEEMMAEIKRVLKPNGICIISTPDKLIYSDKKNYKNPFHIKELYKDEFKSLLSNHFPKVTLLKQHFFSGSLVVPDDDKKQSLLTTFGGSFDAVSVNNNIESEYLIAIASFEPTEIITTSFFVDSEFAQKNIEHFKSQSLRYKVGYFILSPLRIIKELFGRS